MVSDFRRKKYQHVFNTFFDIDKSGAINKKDYELCINTIAKLRGWKETDKQFTVLKDTIQAIWEGLIKEGDKDNDGEISVEEWVTLWDKYANNPATVSDWQTLCCKFLFELEDASRDGAIDSEEFSSVYETFGLCKKDSVEAFKKMAKGKDSVTWAEFQKLWLEYFSTEDSNAPGNYIFGNTTCCH